MTTDSPKQKDSFEQRIIAVLKKIPKGKVANYGLIAAAAGNPRGARQVVRILNSSSEKHKLPWHRVINREGKISLPPGRGYELQKALLEKEGIVFDSNDRINFERFLWLPK
ncbi:MAG: DNA methyltransferase [candidate division Zixibacteria bacterium HGW-Zixibacteria-1]|nr:MAG: DNA methyltransferase [candidate division Zixibacteria bacterium HGW-Zixibacteria-1]